MEGRSSLGIPENVAGLVAYLFGWVSGLVLLLVERDSAFVRFHALQSLLFFGATSLVIAVFARLPVIGWLVALVGGIVSFVYWILGMYKAYQGQLYRFPVVGDIAARQLD